MDDEEVTRQHLCWAGGELGSFKNYSICEQDKSNPHFVSAESTGKSKVSSGWILLKRCD